MISYLLFFVAFFGSLLFPHSLPANSSSQPAVIVLDFGSQYTKLITRRIREQEIFSIILPGDATLKELEGYNPQAVILSGGPSSVYETDAPLMNSKLLSHLRKEKIPILGICYGMQYLMQQLGGKVERAKVKEYGRMPITITPSSTLFSFLNETKNLNVWMSHGDEAVSIPKNFSIVARSQTGTIVAVENLKEKIFALQFHPEVTHSEQGKELLSNFLKKICNLQPNWSMQTFAEEQIAKITKEVGADEHVICALSGGVDSSVAATLVHKAIGERLHPLFVDTGLLRYKEGERVMQLFKEKLGLPVAKIDASDQFYKRLAGVTDPEEKRKIIGKTFIDVFEEYSNSLEKKLGGKPRYLVQGTLYPDVIESKSSSKSKFSSRIKSHHNVGGLPEDLQFSLIEPLRELFKDEVRRLGRSIGVPEEFIQRHPFPGPGLAIRIMGEITPEKIDILQQADEVFITLLKKSGLYNKIWQAGALFLPIKTIGVQGDERTERYVIGLRAVTSQDGMTADWYPFEAKFLASLSNEIINKVPNVNRVVYDISSKPPATIEWE